MNRIKEYWNTSHPFGRLLGWLIAVHVLGLVALSLCRVVFCMANMPENGMDGALLWTAMGIGVKFDNLIACYVAALPVLFVPVWTLCTLHRDEYARWMQTVVKVVTWYFGVIYSILLFVHIANVRYFQFFENHLNADVADWFGFVPETAGLLFHNPANGLFLLIALLFIGGYLCALIVLTRHMAPVAQPTEGLRPKGYLKASLVTILLWGLTFCGMRGSFQLYPLNVSFAYFSNNPFYNKLGVNPVFNIIKSAEHGRVGLPKELAAIDEQEALRFVQNELDIVPTDTLRPIVREVVPEPVVEGQPNVVLIFMESMSAENLERMENGQWLTPYLRELRDKSIYWSNCYSTGIHTNNGIVGVQYGFVPNFAKPMMGVNADIYTGLPYYLHKNGYRNLCFITGNPQYDNMNSFWRDNHIDEIYSQYNYPKEQIVNNFGVSDAYLFEYGLQKLNERSSEGTPFFASFLTVSNHEPFVVPEQYVGRADEPKDQIVAYADDAIRQFVEAARQTSWGRNTIFVLVADHGIANFPHLHYEIPLSFHHIPVYIYSDLLSPQRVDEPTSQIDIWASVLGLLGVPYANNSLGVDVLRQHRKYAFFVSNEHLGVCDGRYFWCYALQSQQEYLYRVGDATNIRAQEPELAAEMRKYGMNMLRVNVLAIDKKWTEPCE